MYPNLFLSSFWQMTLRPQVFVAMSFAEIYRRRFDDVIAPAIRGIQVDGANLEPYRVDFSKSGDSILTDIMDGIAHCQMFLADVSVLGHDSKTGHAFRNGNVMYEVGLAVACRQASEVLLIRDDQERFLFDVSTIPHVHLDFANITNAKQELQERIIERLRERNLIRDARVKKALASLTSDELATIKQFGQHAPPVIWGFKEEASVNFRAMAAIPRLCDKQLIRLCGTWTTGGGAFEWTTLGYSVAQFVLKHLPSLEAIAEPVPSPTAPSPEPPNDKAV